MTDKSKIIAQQNDEFRSKFWIPIFGDREVKGKYFFTTGINNLDPADFIEAGAKVRDFDNFNQDNDPYGEHDFGSFKQNDNTIFWKINYFDVNYKHHSPDPSDLSKTRRILTVMLACEY
jgi:hypothetical protein